MQRQPLSWVQLPSSPTFLEPTVWDKISIFPPSPDYIYCVKSPGLMCLFWEKDVELSPLSHWKMLCRQSEHWKSSPLLLQLHTADIPGRCWGTLGYLAAVSSPPAPAPTRVLPPTIPPPVRAATHSMRVSHQGTWLDQAYHSWCAYHRYLSQ